MSMLRKAVQNHDTTTENGALSHSTSGSACLDLFFRVGGMRGKDPLPLFKRALLENEDAALRIALWLRDVRGGAGERELFRKIYFFLSSEKPELALKVMPKIPEIGRWDDVLSFSVRTQDETFDFIERGLRSGDGLCAKWMPRENGSKGILGYMLRKHMGISSREYRKLLSGLSRTVEQDMSAHKWKHITYSHVPSQAMNKYRQAFYRHDEDRFSQYISEVKKGAQKINASAIHPHELIGRFIGTSVQVGHDNKWNVSVANKPSSKALEAIEAQWYALPDYVAENGKQSLVVCDTSGSMRGTPIQVAVSLAVYFAERNKGEFANEFITFSSNPTFQEVVGDNLYDKVSNLLSTDWGSSTNLRSVFEMILQRAVGSQVQTEHMPDNIIIVSDMQFDQATRGNKLTNYEKIRKMYSKYGYQMPNVVFWNVSSKGQDAPVQMDESGTALISGFSPSILKSVMSSDGIDPIEVMERTIYQDRYNIS